VGHPNCWRTARGDEVDLLLDARAAISSSVTEPDSSKCEAHASTFEWIPHTAKSKAFEVVDIDGGKILDALADEGEGQAIVVGPPASEVPRGEPWPVGVVEGAAVARETDEAAALT
jgi:hypothetical protein